MTQLSWTPAKSVTCYKKWVDYRYVPLPEGCQFSGLISHINPIMQKGLGFTDEQMQEFKKLGKYIIIS